MTTKIIVSTRNPADILTNVVSVSTGDREGTSRIVIQVTKTVQRALQVNDDAILRHVSTGDNKGSVLLRDFATSVEFKAATVQHVDNGFIVHSDDDKSVFFNSAFSSYVAEGKPSVLEDDEEEKPVAAKTTKAKTTAKPVAKTAAKTATKKKVDVEDEGDVEEDVEAEEEKPAKTTKAKTAAKPASKTAAKTTAAKKKVADSLIDDEDGEDDVEAEEEKPAKTAKAKTAAKPAAKTTAAKTAAKAKTTKAKPEIADDADDWGDDE